MSAVNAARPPTPSTPTIAQHVAGELNVSNNLYVLNTLVYTCNNCLCGEFAALVTWARDQCIKRSSTMQVYL
ncbi:MAG: hypothetical protein ACSLEM_02225 [Candidatus Malihini olakiniferum]